MFNGLGEIQNNLGTINDYGPNRMIIDGSWSGTQILGDSTFEFISCSFQLPTASIVSPSVLVRIIDTLQNRYRIDSARIYAVGLSGGGQGFFRSTGIVPLTNYKNIQFTAAVIWSSGSSIPGATLDSIAQWTRKGGGLMYAIGDADIGSRFYTDDVLAAGNSGRAGSTIGYTWTSPPWPTAGHGGWNYGYDSSYKDPTLNINIYEYLLGHTQYPYADAQEDTIITAANNVLLNGIVKQYEWGYNGNGITNYTWTKSSGGAATIINSTNPVTSVTNLEEGDYVFTLTSANAAGGLTASKNVLVQVLDSPLKIIGIKGKTHKWVIEKL